MANRNTTQEATSYKPWRVWEEVPLIVSSLSEANTFYIFRRFGVEIRFVIDGKKILCPTHVLNPWEINWIKNNIIGDV